MSTDYAQVLRGAGLRVTEPRVALLEVARNGGHSSVDQLRRGVLELIGSVSTQAIYDIVHALTKAGLLREIKSSGSVSLYEISQNDNHHHVICKGCGRIEDVPCVVGSRSCMEASEDHGFIIDETEVTFRGYCPDCQKAHLSR
ncbi:MAG: Fur family transcriptional regulator [Actinomycetaceae bacterium]|nr:Fur family transcriptional regulator [Actinomycetaceae bacterium]